MIRRGNIRQLAEKQTGLHPAEDAPILRLPGKHWLFVHDGRLHHWAPKRDESVALADVHIEVNATGQMSRQFSGAGLLAFGVLGASRKRDSRQLFLVAEGTDGAFVISLDPDAIGPATAVAAKFNVAGRQEFASL